MGFIKDNIGENISAYNSEFCELTGLYWAWKNIVSDYIGLVHYRRHFAGKKCGDVWERILTYNDLEPYTKDIKIFVPKKRKYYIETLESHYAHTHYIEHLCETRNIITDKYPNYLNCYDRVIKQRSGYMFNMMIMKRELLNDYCEWLFDILFDLKNKVDVKALSDFQRRYLGRISEILFNVWLNYQIQSKRVRRNEIKELPVIYMEKIDWKRKIAFFLEAKFMGKKYESSF